MKTFLVLVAIALLCGSASAQTPAKSRCPEPARRGLDFWIGRWTVTDTASGQAIAESVVEPMFGGCALRETYDQTVGPGGQPTNYHASSYTAYNTGDSTWRQFYVDTSGAAFSYVGRLQGQSVTFEARAGSLGTRMTFRPMADGTVRQTGEVTKDNAVTWQPNFDFTYRPR